VRTNIPKIFVLIAIPAKNAGTRSCFIDGLFKFFSNEYTDKAIHDANAKSTSQLLNDAFDTVKVRNMEIEMEDSFLLRRNLRQNNKSAPQAITSVKKLICLQIRSLLNASPIMKFISVNIGKSDCGLKKIL
jgi:hypothetical protein